MTSILTTRGVQILNSEFWVGAQSSTQLGRGGGELLGKKEHEEIRICTAGTSLPKTLVGKFW